MNAARSGRGSLWLVSGESSESQSVPDYYLGKNQEIDCWRVHSLSPGFSTEARLLHWWNWSALPLPATLPVFRVGWFPSTLKASIRPHPRFHTLYMTHKLENYLRTYRKKSGLTQREVAFLLGCQNGAQVSRYEKRRRLPPLRTALAYEAAMGVSVSQLFAGIYEEVSNEIEKRLAKLEAQLQKKKSKGSEDLMNARKLRWLTGRLNSKCPSLRTKL